MIMLEQPLPKNRQKSPLPFTRSFAYVKQFSGGQSPYWTTSSQRTSDCYDLNDVTWFADGFHGMPFVSKVGGKGDETVATADIRAEGSWPRM